jgi:GT2 family glycosyltransferase
VTGCTFNATKSGQLRCLLRALFFRVTTFRRHATTGRIVSSAIAGAYGPPRCPFLVQVVDELGGRIGPADAMTGPLVSILIPAFNQQEFIEQTLCSAIEQTWHRTEIIVVDDGSTDETARIAQRFASGRVLVVTQPHAGAATARNTALSLCQGDYVQFLDADDLLAPDKIAAQLRARDERSTSRTLFSCPWGRFLYRPHRAFFTPSGLWTDLMPAEWLLRKLELNVFIQTACWLVSRELVELAKPWDTQLSMNDDEEYFGRVLLQSDRVRFVADANVLYRLCGTSRLSHVGRSREKMESQLRSIELTIRYLRLLDDGQRARAACLTYLQNSLLPVSRHPHGVTRLKKMAADLGCDLGRPHLSWKYAWIAATFNLASAASAASMLGSTRWSVSRLCDKALLRLENLHALQRRSREPGTRMKRFDHSHAARWQPHPHDLEVRLAQIPGHSDGPRNRSAGGDRQSNGAA